MLYDNFKLPKWDDKLLPTQDELDDLPVPTDEDVVREYRKQVEEIDYE